RLRGIGPKSAQRLAFHVLKTPREQTDRLADALREVKEQVTYCSICNNITDVDPCAFCSNDARDPHVICVVEEPQNVAAIEKTREFKGRYHVLMGALSPLQGVGPDDLKIKGLLSRVGGGALSCFAGYRLFKIVLGIYGFILGAMLASSMMAASNTVGMVVAALVGGVIGALALMFAYFVGIALVGAGLGALIAHVGWG